MQIGISKRLAGQFISDVTKLKSTKNVIEYTLKPLKIALITETWPPELNGVALSILQLAQRLQQRGHQFLLVRPQQKVILENFKPEKECLVRAQAIPKSYQMQFDWPQIFELGQAFDDFQPDIVHIVTEGPLGLAALNQAKQRDIPVSSGFHSSFHDFSRYFDLAFLLGPIRRYLKWFHNQTQLTCVPSQDTLSALAELGVSCPMQVVGRGVDPQHFSSQHRNMVLRRKWGASADTTVLINVGSASSEKELACVFSGYNSLKQRQPHRKFCLVIIGGDSVFAQYREQTADLIFLDVQTNEDLAQCYASADLLVSSSHLETLNNMVLEAMASGLPVLSYDVACIGKLIEEDQEGWLAPPNEPATWQEKLATIPDHHQLKKLGQQARLKMESCNWDQPVADFEAALIRYAKK